jgi:hypothetical protein
MVLLGRAVGLGSTPLDDWFQAGRQTVLRYLLCFTDARVVLGLLLVVTAVVAYRRQWLVVGVMLVTPLAAVSVVTPLKLAFGRFKGDSLCFPSGHTTLMVVALGMVLLGLGGSLWRTVAAISWGVLGIIGISVTYHYFTDAVAAALLGSSFVAVAAAIVDRCQPRPSLRPISQLR